MAIVTFRTDDLSEAALTQLTADGTEKSDAIRRALIFVAGIQKQEALQATAARLAENPEYLAEIAAIQNDFDDLRAW